MGSDKEISSAAGTRLLFFMETAVSRSQSQWLQRGSCMDRATLPSQRVLLDRSGTEPPGILRWAVAKHWEQLGFSELPPG